MLHAICTTIENFILKVIHYSIIPALMLLLILAVYGMYDAVVQLIMDDTPQLVIKLTTLKDIYYAKEIN